MRTIKQKLQKLSAWVLAAALLGSSFDGFLSAEAAAASENNAAILSFSELSEDVKEQTLKTGAAESEIRLPDELGVTVELPDAGNSGGEDETDTNAAEPETQPKTEPETQSEQTEQEPEQTEPQSDGESTNQMPDEAGGEEQTDTGVTVTETQESVQDDTTEEIPPETVPEQVETQGESQSKESAAEVQNQPETYPEVISEPEEAIQEQSAGNMPDATAPQTVPEEKTPETENTQAEEEDGILMSLLDAVFPSMTVHAAETNSRTVTLTDITWKIDETKSNGGMFQSEKAAEYVYVPELPGTVTIDGIDYTLELGESVQLPEITVTIAEKTDGYGTIIHEGTTGDCRWTLYDTDGDNTEDLLVIGGTGAMPDYYGSAERPWNDYRENIKKVVVEEGITALGYLAFTYCSNLEEVTLPSTLEKIGTYAFDSCESLDTLVIPSGVTEIGEQSFGNCSGLVSITLPDTLKSIGQFAFYQCGLVEIEIPKGVETIGYRTFTQCYSLQSVILPDTLISIGEDAFYYDSSLTIIIPESVQAIGDSAFSRAKAVYNLSDCTVTGGSISKKVNYDKITLVENGKSSEQRVLPANCVAGSRYAGTRYDTSYYYSSGEGNTTWYVQNGVTYEKVTSGTSFQNTPTFYYAKAFDDATVAAEAAGESGDSYTLVVRDKETGETLTEGTHYTQKMTDSTDWAETDTGSLTKTVTVTITGIAGGGYVGTMQTTFQISAKAEASVTADGSTTKYPAFEDAWKDAQGKTAEVTLLADAEVSATLTVTSGSNITLKSEADGNGGTYTISGDVFNSDSGMIDVAAGGTLTLESGTVENGAGGNNAIAVNGGRFVLKGGNAAATADGHSGVCVYNSGTAQILTGNVSGDIGVAAASDGSAITISDGNISGRASGVYVSGSGAKITITGGTISASNTEGENGADGAALRIQGTGSALLSGGTYSGAYSIFINNGNSITLKELLDDRISGGTISGDTSFFGSGLRVLNTAADVSLSGGSFSGNTSVDMWVGGTIGSILAPGYAYKGTDWGVYEYWLSEAAASQSNSTTLVTVQKAPIQSVNISPATTTITYGDTATILTATVTQPDGSTNDVTYQWYLDGVKIDGATGETYTPDKLDAGEYAYTCTATVDGYSLSGTAAAVTVNRADIENAVVTLTGTRFEYLGGTLEIGVQSVELNGTKLNYGTDYTYSGHTGKDADTYTVKVEGKGNYTGTATATWEIYPRKLNVKDWTIEKVYDGTTDIVLNGTEFQLDGGYPWYGQDDDIKLDASGVTAQFLDASVGEGKDITYTGEFTLTGKDAGNYILKKMPASLTGTITRRKITVTPDSLTKEYGADDPELTYQLTSGSLLAGHTLTLGRAEGESEGSHAINTFTIVDQDGNNVAGNYDMTLEEVDFQITKPDLATATVTLEQTSFIYDGTARTPGVTVVKNGRTLEKDTDYTVTYENNVDVGTASVTITALENGSYDGSQTVTFEIKSVEDVISVEVSWDALEYTYTDGAWNPDAYTYEEGEWTADNGGNSITVKNTGSVDTTVSYLYSPSVTTVSGRFSGDDGNFIDAPVALARGEERKAYLALAGRPSSDFTAGTLGTVTVTIGGEE